MTKGLLQKPLNPSFVSINSVQQVSLRASSELQTKTKLGTRLPAVRAQNASSLKLSERGSDPYQFMTPQKMPLRQQLFNSATKQQSSDKKSASTLTKRPIRVALQDQLRGTRQSDTEISTMRSLAKSFKSRPGLRNEPLLMGSGLPKTEPVEDIVPLATEGSIY